MILSILLLALPVHAQTFEVASVKPHVRDAGYTPLSCTNGRFVTTALRLSYIIDWAYNLNADQSRDMEEKLPPWTQQADGVYDIEAKSSTPVSDSQCRQFVQTLLTGRFHFAAHWETREAQIDELVLAKGGPKMPKALPTDEGRDFSFTLNGREMQSLAPPGQPKGRTMAELAEFLASLQRHEPIVDKTGLEGKYKIVLKISFPVPNSTEVYDDPDLETALQQQLGLKLERHKGTIQILIPDHLDRPTPN
ncbi:MAG TPA: TIGR03435 family protein [Bryobacteraceae bacterium]|jgi:uncharacterized protein (TIGR03435 family)